MPHLSYTKLTMDYIVLYTEENSSVFLYYVDERKNLKISNFVMRASKGQQEYYQDVGSELASPLNS